jgi:hypothetical protein
MEADRELIDNRVQSGEDLVADIVFAQVVPEMFDY